MAKRNSNDQKSTYLIVSKGGRQQKVTVPSSWKVTFGPIAPGSRDHTTNGRGGLCLRFYENANRQRAVFTDVESFRDLSIAIEERVTKVEEQRAYRETPEGRRDFVVEAHVSEWRNPDDPVKPGSEFRVLPNAGRLSDEEPGF